MKNYTTKRCELPITILTDYEHRQDDLIESVRQQIEQSGFHLQTLFNNLKRSALFMETYFTDDAPDQVRGFCNDLMNTADVGNGLCGNIWRAAAELTALQMKDESASENEPPETPVIIDAESEVDEKSDAEILAEKISYLIRSDDVPSPISGGLLTILNNFYNEHIDQNEFEDDSSIEYISRLLKSSRFFTLDGTRTEDEQ